MKTENKLDLSISMLRASILAIFIMVPIAVLQFSLFNILNHMMKITVTFNLMGILLFGIIVLASVVAHELIHGLTWVAAGKKPFSAVKFGVDWKTLTPFAHLNDPIEVNVYRIGGIMPGLVLGILPFFLSLITGNNGLLWFSILQTAAASGDWVILLMLRNVKNGTLVEDHPTRAGCYSYISQ